MCNWNNETEAREQIKELVRWSDKYRVAGDLANTDFIMNNTFGGVYLGMTDEMIDSMAKVIAEAVNQ